MRTSYFYRIATFCAGLGLLSGAASASSFSFQGTFNTDEQLEIFSFVAGPGAAIIQTWGFAGTGAGTNAAGQTIAAGGFDPFISLFGPGPLTASTPLLASNQDGDPAIVLVDPTTSAQFDSYLDTSLVPLGPPEFVSGQTYFLVLTESPSLPGSVYGDGFSGQGQGDYTGPIFGCAAAAFCDVNGDQRNGNWALDITGVTAAQDLNATPEPGSLGLMGCAMAGIVTVWRRRKVSTVGRPS